MLPFSRVLAAALISAISMAGASAVQGQVSVPQALVFPPPSAGVSKAPDGSPGSTGPYAVKIPATLLDEQGAVALWFKLDGPMPGPKNQVRLFRSDAMEARLYGGGNPVQVRVYFRSAMAGRGPAYRYRAYLTHLEGKQWYYAAWNWDVEDTQCNGFFLDGIRQENQFPRPGQIKAADCDVAFKVGGQNVTVSALGFYEEPLSEQELKAICNAAGHEGYTDEGVRFTSETFIPMDVDFDHPVYETSFDDPSALADWHLEGGIRKSVQGGNLVLESRVFHLVCWLKREVPPDFLLEFTVRPKNRKEGLNIVFFSACGKNNENIFEAPIRLRNGLFLQYTRGDFNNYHISYWAPPRGTSNLRKNAGFKLPAIGKDLVYTALADTFQTIRVYKRGNKIRLMVDDVLALTYDDDGKTYGPVYNHPGWIGLRQMGHTRRCEYGHVKIYPLTKGVSD